MTNPKLQSEDRNGHPAKFFGDGVTFKAKLIGILEVGEARGDRMCQEALQDLKMAIRAAGEHKQRITIHVTIDGLRLRDEKTGDCLYHHPVHKISFIAQDVQDSRAFGYIFGSPDSGHRFFGIKTDKSASQVVLAMRDLFQVVFELKKKEIELARQHIQSKTIHEHPPITIYVKNTNAESSATASITKEATTVDKGAAKIDKTTDSIDLVDLEQELSSIQRGITQMERITPNTNDPTSKSNVDSDDPFGDSFTNFPKTYNLLPPPESSKSRHSKPLKPPEEPSTDSNASLLPPASSGGTDDWLNSSTTPPVVFDESRNDENNFKSYDENSLLSLSGLETKKYVDAFTDLDPLGTGKNKPYVDKKYFFHDLKNPPKKVLKDLGQDSTGFTANFSATILNSNSDDTKNEQNKICDIDLKLFENDLSGGDSQNKSLDNIETNFQETSLFGKKLSNDIFQRTEIDGQHNNNNNHNNHNNNNNNVNNKTEETILGKMSNDFTDPFTNNKIDPFMDDDDFSKVVSLDPFDFNFNGTKTHRNDSSKQNQDEPTKIITKSYKTEDKKKVDVFNGPLQVNLPPESWSSQINHQKKLERQSSETNNTISSLAGGGSSSARNRPSVFKQNTVDVISSISSKKMKPHIFSQKFSKRDSNSINMRRLQESDSLSENETAPEPPPRPDSASHIEPPPLPPKKQFSDIVIRPRTSSSSSSSLRYDFLSSKSKNQNENAPPLPLPSRKVGRSESSYPGPGRPTKKSGDDDDYLAPIGSVPILLPPPQTRQSSKSRPGRKIEYTETKSEQIVETKINNEPIIIPDITLSQLLTLGIDDLAAKLNVPTLKLSTMTLIELTTYLSDFIENAKKKIPEPPTETPNPAVFKVNFDQPNDETFVTTFNAKFDDSFGEETFVANFDTFNSKFDAKAGGDSNKGDDGESGGELETRSANSIDKYAVFREIIEQEMYCSSNEPDSFETPMGSLTMPEDEVVAQIIEQNRTSPRIVLEEDKDTIVAVKIDTKITEAISNAKDRYAALRDIILVEDLFDKPNSYVSGTEIDKDDEDGDDYKQVENINNMSDIEISEPLKGQRDTNDNSPEINISSDPEQQPGDDSDKNEHETLSISNVLNNNNSTTTKDDIEIDEYMQRAISNLSLDSRDHLSPIASKSPIIAQSQNASTSPIRLQQNKSPGLMTQTTMKDNILPKTTLNDMSTSPIPIQKSPMIRSPIQRSPLAKSPAAGNRSPVPHAGGVTSIMMEEQCRVNSGSLSDVVCGSSPEDNIINKSTKGTPTIEEPTTESWAVFDQPIEPPIEAPIKSKSPMRIPETLGKGDADSPCSSDGKEEWKSAQEYNRRWPKGQTSSSSRDVSPWDEDGPEYRRRYHAPDKLGHHVRHARRMNSCDEDYEFDEKLSRRRERKVKPTSATRSSRENFESENWYHLNDHQSWSPEDEEPRNFDRSAYERSTYPVGPPYEKRETKGSVPYDRRVDYKSTYDKRKYQREYTRPDYDIDPYRDNPENKDVRRVNYYEDDYDRRNRGRKEYDETFDQGTFERESNRGSHKGGREYFYERDKRSFDRESVESYESGRRQRSFGSGEIYGSLDNRGDFRDRDRHIPSDKTRSWRKGMRSRPDEEYDQDSEGDMTRPTEDTRSLQRSAPGPRVRKSSGSSPWDGDDLTPTSGQKSWKRPSSATEPERRMAENKRILCNTLSGSDGEKDRRFRKKTRSRSEKEVPEVRSNYASLRYPRRPRGDDYFDFDEAPNHQIPIRSDPNFVINDDDKGGNQRLPENIERQYYSKREQFFKSTTPRSEGRTMSDSLRSQEIGKHPIGMCYEGEPSERKKHSPREGYIVPREKNIQPSKFTTFDEPKQVTKHVRMEFEFDEFDDTPRSTTSSKFNYEEEQGFESDFNSPPPPTQLHVSQMKSSSGKGFRFSNDFTSNDQKNSPRIPKKSYQYEPEYQTTTTTPTTTCKLRFDDNVTISKFTKKQSSEDDMFEDDFSKAEFAFEDEDKWSELPKKSLKSSKQHEIIKKSDSVNIFAKKVQDPFEDDDFFQPKSSGNNNNDKKQQQDSFQWEKNFAKFDKNI